MVGRISGLYTKSLTSRVLVVCLPSSGSHPAGVDVFWGRSWILGEPQGPWCPNAVTS
jgi:hypothetical protein